jgi:hypothetical protein
MTQAGLSIQENMVRKRENLVHMSENGQTGDWPACTLRA